MFSLASSDQKQIQKVYSREWRFTALTDEDIKNPKIVTFFIWTAFSEKKYRTVPLRVQ